MNIYEFGDQPIAELEAASPASLHDMHNELRVTMALADVHEQTTACSVLYEAPGNHELKLEVSAGVTERDILKHGFKVTADNMYLAHGGHTPTATRETLVRHMGKLIDGFFDNCEVPPNE